MITTIVQFEYKNWLLQKATLLFFLLWCAVLFFSITNGSKSSQAITGKIEIEKKKDSVQLKSHMALMDSTEKGLKPKATVYWDDARNAYTIGLLFGVRPAVKLPLNFSSLAIGQSDLFPSINSVSTSPAYWFMPLRATEKLDNPVNKLFGNFDWCYVIIWLMPLLIIVFNYNILSSKKKSKVPSGFWWFREQACKN